MKNVMFTKEEITDLIKRAYGTSTAHGFSKRASVEHCVMLIITEVSEAVDADRKDRRANLKGFELLLPKYTFEVAFNECVKDTVEDELSDVCIRIFSMCGALGIVPDVPADNNHLSGMLPYAEQLFIKEKSFVEQCFYLCNTLSRCDGGAVEEGNAPYFLGAVLSLVMLMSDVLGFDLKRHIELKMRYNETRPYKHGGKKY